MNAGVAGDWQRLVTLVRLPLLQALQCPAATEQPCKLTGSNLFLVDSVSGDPQFKEGDLVQSMMGWREAFTAPGQLLSKLPASDIPSQAFLGAAGMPPSDRGSASGGKGA